MKCPICDQKKAKRFCPAKGILICTNCCGEKRVLEIDCPESCQYLQAGRRVEVKLHNRYYGSPDSPLRQKHERIFREFESEIAHLEFVLAEERQSLRDFTDRHAAEALELVLQNLRTEESGVLYERTSNDFRVEGARRRLTGTIQRLRSTQLPERQAHLVVRQPGNQGMKLRAVIECVEMLRQVVKNHIDEGAPSYVEFLARLVPKQPPKEDAGSRLIVPGR